jgi:effector-binding domain-containing protein
MTMPPGLDEPSMRDAAAQASAVRVVRTTLAELPSVVPAELRALLAALGDAGLAPRGAAFGRYLDDPQGGPFRLEVGVPVAADVAAPEGTERSELPGGRQLVGVYRGGYEGLGAAWVAVGGSLGERGLQAAGPPWEAWLRGPGDTERAEEYVTEIVFPIA